MARTAGSLNKPRERVLRQLEDAYPDFAPLVKMVEHAEEAAKLVQANQEATAADHAMMVGLYEKVARYLVPQLRAVDLSVGGEGGGPITVTFQRTIEANPEP